MCRKPKKIPTGIKEGLISVIADKNTWNNVTQRENKNMKVFMHSTNLQNSSFTLRNHRRHRRQKPFFLLNVDLLSVVVLR